MVGFVLHGTVAYAAWPVVSTVYDGTEGTQAICVASNNGVHWFVGEQVNAAQSNSRVYVKRHNGTTLSAREGIWADPLGVDRLTSNPLALAACAVDGILPVQVSMKRDATGFTNPTIENVVINRLALTLVDNPPELVDEDTLLTPIRKQSSIAINEARTDVFACWTLDAGLDDIRCRGRDSSSTNWSDGYASFADPAIKEEHPSVAIRGTVSPERVVAYRNASVGVKVRLFDDSNPMVEVTPNDVDIGGVGATDVNWPHIVQRSETLHLVAWDTTAHTLIYGTCATNCHQNSSWTTENIDDVIPAAGDAAKHPQIAVDSDGRVFVAFNFDGSGMAADNERVKVTARCTAGDWADAPELVDDSGGREQLGGFETKKSHPSFVYNETDDRLSVVYQYTTAAVPVDFIGRWARKSTDLAFTDLCP